MLSCKDITEKANQYLDNELSFSMRMKIKIHLFMCVNCKNYIKQLKQTILALGKFQDPRTLETSDKDVEQIVTILKQSSSVRTDNSE